MMHDPASVTRAHLAIQRDGPSHPLKRQRCACGAQVTARQMAQHRRCPACVKLGTAWAQLEFKISKRARNSQVSREDLAAITLLLRLDRMACEIGVKND